MPQDINGFYNFKENYYKAIDGEITNDIVVDSFVKLVEKKNFDSKWIDSFLDSMEMDITKKNYETLDETLEYIYGSAEVIGLMMARTMDLSDESLYYAKYLGRSMQFINFTRDIAEDIKLGRIYFPSADIESYGLKNLNYEHTIKNPDKFNSFIHEQLLRYCKWQKIAEEGFKYIPKRYLIPIKTASEMYNWTAEQIYKDPFILYKIKVKPMIKHIFRTIVLNVIEPKKSNHNLYNCMIKDAYPQVNY
jgi:phytoene synthase